MVSRTNDAGFGAGLGWAGLSAGLSCLLSCAVLCCAVVQVLSSCAVSHFAMATMWFVQFSLPCTAGSVVPCVCLSGSAECESLAQG